MADSVAWLAAAFGVVWVALGAYLWRLWRDQRRLAARLSRLEGDSPPPAA